MNQRNASMTVIGAGSYGTALAITLARNGHEVVLWGHDPEHIATLERDRCNAAFLPDVPFPDTLHLESDLATALAASRVLSRGKNDVMGRSGKGTGFLCPKRYFYRMLPA